jgi:anti-sigma B factor antagonist
VVCIRYCYCRARLERHLRPVRPADPPPLLLDFETRAGATLRAIVSGEIDFSSAPSMQARVVAACEREGAHSLILDLSSVEFMDSSGLRVILHLQRELSNERGGMVLFGPTEEVRKILRLTGLDQHLTVANTLPQAEELLREALEQREAEELEARKAEDRP